MADQTENISTGAILHLSVAYLTLVDDTVNQKKMKFAFVRALIVLSSTTAIAQGTTRVEVRQELIELESVAYDPGADNLNYPSNLNTAEWKLAQLKSRAAARLQRSASPATQP